MRRCIHLSLIILFFYCVGCSIFAPKVYKDAMQIALRAENQREYEKAYEYYENALKSYKGVLNYNVVNDDILFKVAKIYDSPFKLRDIEKAYKYYKSIIEKYSDSIHYKYAERRVKFFEKNFFNYR